MKTARGGHPSPMKGKKMSAELRAKIRAGQLAKARSPEERFFAKVSKTDTCWQWTGSVWHSYGNFLFRGKVWQAHRVSWVLAGRELPEKPLVLDHICRNQTCVNPDHLRIVTPRMNALENNGSPFAMNAQKTCCVNGHPFTPENTSVHVVKNRKNRHGNPSKPSPARVCLACKRERYHREKTLALHGKLPVEGSSL